MNSSTLTITLAQIAPVWFDKKKTLAKVCDAISDAAARSCELVVFGEALVPGYPFWLPLTNGAAWDDPVQKELHTHYVRNAVQIEKGDLAEVCTLARQLSVSVYLGVVERPSDRGGHSLYCSLVFIDSDGQIRSVHRKLQPTYDERLVWATGDGHGLMVHPLKDFTVGGLNCWENWMPLSRAALYGQGEDLHIAVWPGSDRNTRDITRFMALEGRSFVVSVSALMRKSDIPAEGIPFRDRIFDQAPEVLANGGSCVAGPDGKWIVEPVTGREEIIVVTIDHAQVLGERQNFDPAGHYSRPDVTRLFVNRERQGIVEFE